MLAQLAVEQAALELVAGDVVPEAEGLEEVLVDDVGAGGDDRVDHVVADHVDEDLLQARARSATRPGDRMTPHSLSLSMRS